MFKKILPVIFAATSLSSFASIDEISNINHVYNRIASSSNIQIYTYDYQNNKCWIKDLNTNNYEKDMVANCNSNNGIKLTLLPDPSRGEHWYYAFTSEEIYRGKKCAVQWDSAPGVNRFNNAAIGSNEHNLKIDCNSTSSDPIRIDIVDVTDDELIVTIASESGNMQWGSEMYSGDFRAVKFDPDGGKENFRIIANDVTFNDLFDSSLATGGNYNQCLIDAYSASESCKMSSNTKDQIKSCKDKYKRYRKDCKIAYDN